MSVSPATRAPGRSRAATRARILESARALFAERGLHAVTSHEIANGAGVASGTFYLHFKDKQALFREIAVGAAERLKQRLDERTAGLDTAAAVAARSDELMRFADEHRDLVRILFGPGGDPAVADEVLTRLAIWVEAQAVGGEAAGLHPTVFAQARVGMCARVMFWWAADPERIPRQTVVDTLIALQRIGDLPGGD